MAEDRTLEILGIGILIGGFLTYLLTEINKQLMIYNYRSSFQDQYIQSPQREMLSAPSAQTTIYSNDEEYVIERDSEGFIKYLNIARDVKADI